MQRLGASKITLVDFPPKEMVFYCKETQTPVNTHLSEGTSLHGYTEVNSDTFMIYWAVIAAFAMMRSILFHGETLIKYNILLDFRPENDSKH